MHEMPRVVVKYRLLRQQVFKIDHQRRTIELNVRDVNILVKVMVTYYHQRRTIELNVVLLVKCNNVYLTATTFRNLINDV